MIKPSDTNVRVRERSHEFDRTEVNRLLYAYIKCKGNLKKNSFSSILWLNINFLRWEKKIGILVNKNMICGAHLLLLRASTFSTAKIPGGESKYR